MEGLFTLKKSLDAFVNIALRVCTSDDEVDNMLNEAYDVVKHAIGEYPDRVSYLINLLLVSRYLERIADHTTNIAEEVIYFIEGEIVQHENYL